MVDWNKKFKKEYDYARAFLSQDTLFSKDWQSLVRDLQKLMTPEGFDAGRATALSDLRKKVTKGDSTLTGHKKVGEDHGLLNAVGAWTDDAGPAVEPQARMRAAALKLLRHVYLVNRSGNRKTWVVSLPTELQDWPSLDLNARGTTQIAARLLLRSSSEIFNEEAKKHLGVSTQQSLAWCQKAGIVLALAASGLGGKAGSKSVTAINLVKRWFADPGTSAPELATYVARLQQGFKDMIGMLNKGQFVVTDWVPLRTATAQGDVNFLNSEAFTFAGGGEGMDVVYIERSFFTDHAGSVLPGQKNWTRVMVHELTHLVCNTEDVNIGATRYAHYGIGPHAGFPGSAAIRNADSWAFFCADCANVLTDGERAHALRIR